MAFEFFRRILLARLLLASALRNSQYPLMADYNEYYYLSVRDKMNESMSLNNCTVAGKNWFVGDNHLKPELFLRIVPPSKHVRKNWGYLNHEKSADDSKLFLHISNNLCEHTLFKKLKTGHWGSAKGCYKIYKRVKGVLQKVRYKYGATLHPDHIRCNVDLSASVCSSGEQSPIPVRTEDRRFHNYPFVVKSNYGVLVARSGMLALPCGPFGLLASCEALNWGVITANAFVPNVTECRNYHRRGVGKCEFPAYDKVFVMSQYDDTQIGQFILESLPRLVYHLPYLLENPDVIIHYGFTKQPTVPAFVLPHIIFDWLGLRHRLTNGTIYAKEVVMAREGGCQETSYGAWEIVNQRETFFQLSLGKLYKGDKSLSKLFSKIDPMLPDESPLFLKAELKRPVVLLLERNPSSRYIQNQMDQYTRMWPNKSAPILKQELERLFPRHDILSFSDKDVPLMQCPPCQVRMFYRAEIVIGMHGAGLTNTIYMKRGGVVVEVLPYYDSRHSAITGIFPRVSSMIGLHHYSYLIAGTSFDPYRFTKDVADYYDYVVLLEQDMLPSDGVIDTANTEIQIEAPRGYCFTAVVIGL